MTINVGDLIQTTVSYQSAGSSVMQNTLHFRVFGSAGSTATDASFLASLRTFLDGLYGNLEDVISADCQDLTSESWITEFIGTPPKWTLTRVIGTTTDALFIPVATGDELAPGVAMCVLFYTLVPKHQGRKYLGGFTEADQQADGTPSANLVNSCAAYAVDLLTGFSVSGTPEDLDIGYVVLDRTFGGDNVAIAALTKAEFAYQRRRRRSVGI